MDWIQRQIIRAQREKEKQERRQEMKDWMEKVLTRTMALALLMAMIAVGSAFLTGAAWLWMLFFRTFGG